MPEGQQGDAPLPNLDKNTGTSHEPAGDEIYRRCRAEIYDPIRMPWEKVGKELLALDHEEYDEENQFDESVLFEDLTNKHTTAVILRDSVSGKIVGFTYAQRIADTYIDDVEDIPRADAGIHTAYINSTIVGKAYRGHKLVGKMINELKLELVRKNFRFLERHAREANNYAANIRKAEAGNIVLERRRESQFGPQVFFRIKLPTEIPSQKAG